MPGMSRSKALTMGVAAVLSAGAGSGWALAQGSGRPDAVSVVAPVTPCRLVDTRPGAATVGTRSTPLGSGEILTLDVWGSQGSCSVPAGTTGIVANVTVANPTADGYLTVWPADAPQPNASNLNWRAHQGPTPNQVTTALSSGGRLSVFNSAGTVDVIIDVAGYFVDQATAPAGPNRQRIATLQWYDTTNVARFTVGTDPGAIAFDGTAVWVVNRGSGTVTRIRATDGLLLGTYAVGTNPQGIAFDGAHIWVANTGSNTLTELNAGDGSLAATVVVPEIPNPVPAGIGGVRPSAIAFDGDQLWVATATSFVERLSPLNGALLGVAGQVGTRAIVVDGSQILTTSNGKGGGAWLNAFDPATGTQRYSAFVGKSDGNAYVGGAGALAYDGRNVWVLDTNFQRVVKVDAVDGTVLGAFAVGNGPSGIVFDGADVWITNHDDNTVTRLHTSDGSLVGTYAVGHGPSGIAFDGADIWVSNADDGTVSKL